VKADDVKRLKELEAENAKLKPIVADQLLDIEGLKELSRGRMKDQVFAGVGVVSALSPARSARTRSSRYCTATSSIARR
jgi:hypothetical protein